MLPTVDRSRLWFSMNTHRRAPGRFLGVVAACLAGLYLGLFLAAIGPTARILEQDQLEVAKDSEAIRRNPLDIFRYYGSVQGDAYLYFELGMRTVGRALPQDAVARRLSRVDAAARSVTGPQLPYRDFKSVYPPLAVGYFSLLALVCGSFDSFFLTLRCLNLLAIVAIVALSYEQVRRRNTLTRLNYLAVSATLVVALGPRWLCMYDAVPALCVSIALHACCRQRPATAGVALAAGAWLKIYPVLLGPLALVYFWRVCGWKATGRYLGAGLLATTVMLGPWLITSPASLVTGVLTQASRQYLTYDSALGSLFVIGRQAHLVQFQYGDELESRVVGGPASHALARTAPVLMLMAVAGLTVACGVGFRRTAASAREERLPTSLVFGFLAIHVAILLTSVVFSPQYVLWLLPVLLPLIDCAAGIAAAGIVCGLCIQLQYPMVEGLSSSLREICLMPIFVVRNLGLLSLARLSWPMRWNRSPA